MKLTVTPERLASALKAASLFTASRNTIPVLQNVLVEAGGDGTLRIRGTTIDTSGTVCVPAEVDEPGRVTLPAKRFADIASGLSTHPVRVQSDGTGARVVCGDADFRLAGIDPEEFPSFPEVEGPEWTLPASALRQAIDQTAFCTSRDESRPNLQGSLWEARDGNLRAVATDGHRLGMVDLRATLDDELQGVIVPAAALAAAQKLLPETGAVTLVRNENHLLIRFDGGEILVRLIEGPFPAYEAVIPRESDRTLTVGRDEMVAALRLVSVVASDQTHRVRLSLGGNLAVRAETPDLGHGKQIVAAEYEGEPMEIGFNVNYLVDTLRRVPSDRVRMSFTSPERGVLVEPVDSEVDATYVVMPLRLIG